jgi:hypothetical protein
VAKSHLQTKFVMLGAESQTETPFNFHSGSAAFNIVEKPSAQIRNKYGDNGEQPPRCYVGLSTVQKECRAELASIQESRSSVACQSPREKGNTQAGSSSVQGGRPASFVESTPSGGTRDMHF